MLSTSSYRGQREAKHLQSGERRWTNSSLARITITTHADHENPNQPYWHLIRPAAHHHRPHRHHMGVTPNWMGVILTYTDMMWSAGTRRGPSVLATGAKTPALAKKSYMVSRRSATHVKFISSFNFQSPSIIVCPACPHGQGAGDGLHGRFPARNSAAGDGFKAGLAKKYIYGE